MNLFARSVIFERLAYLNLTIFLFSYVASIIYLLFGNQYIHIFNSETLDYLMFYSKFPVKINNSTQAILIGGGSLFLINFFINIFLFIDYVKLDFFNNPEQDVLKICKKFIIIYYLGFWSIDFYSDFIEIKKWRRVSTLYGWIRIILPIVLAFLFLFPWYFNSIRVVPLSWLMLISNNYLIILIWNFLVLCTISFSVDYLFFCFLSYLFYCLKFRRDNI